MGLRPKILKGIDNNTREREGVVQQLKSEV